MAKQIVTSIPAEKVLLSDVQCNSVVGITQPDNDSVYTVVKIEGESYKIVNVNPNNNCFWGDKRRVYSSVRLAVRGILDSSPRYSAIMFDSYSELCIHYKI